MLPAGLVNDVNAIMELREGENERKNAYPNVFPRLESIAQIQPVKGSNAGEGAAFRATPILFLINDRVTFGFFCQAANFLSRISPPSKTKDANLNASFTL